MNLNSQLFLFLCFVLLLPTTFTAPLKRRGGSTGIQLCDDARFPTFLKDESADGNYRKRLTDAHKGGLIRGLLDVNPKDLGNLVQMQDRGVGDYHMESAEVVERYQGPDGREVAAKARNLRDSVVLEADHISEAQYIKYLIKSVMMPNNFQRYCKSSNLAERGKLFTELKEKINSPRNLKWLQSTANKIKKRFFGDLINSKTNKKPPLPNYGESGTLASDTESLRGTALYSKDTIMSQFEVAQDVYEVFEASTEYKSLLEVDKETFIKQVHEELTELMTHVQARVKVYFENEPDWEMPTLDEVNAHLKQTSCFSVVNGKRSLNRRCLAAPPASPPPPPPPGAAGIGAAGAILPDIIPGIPLILGGFSSSQPSSSSTQVAPPTSEPAQTPSMSSSPASSSSSTPPLPPPPPVTSSTSTPTSTFTPITSSFVGPVNLNSLVSSVSAGFTPPPTSAPAPTSTLFPLGTNTLPTYTNLGDLGINTIHLAGGGSLHEQ